MCMSLGQWLVWIGGPAWFHLPLFAFIQSSRTVAYASHTATNLRSFFLLDVSTSFQELFAKDTLASLQHDLDMILVSHPSTMPSHQWVSDLDSSVNAYHHPKSMTCDPPWISQHLSQTQSSSPPSLGHLGRLACCLLPFGFTRVTAAKQHLSLVYHWISTQPSIPSALLQGPATLLWKPATWRT